MTRTTLALVLLACGLWSCGGGDPSNEVAFATIARPCASNVAVAEGVVARNQVDFDGAWSACHARLAPPPRPPALDFAAQQVVGYFLGVRPDGCHSVSIVRIRRLPDQLRVEYREEVAPAGTACTQALTYPAHLVSMERSDLPVHFVAEGSAV